MIEPAALMDETEALRLRRLAKEARLANSAARREAAAEANQKGDAGIPLPPQHVPEAYCAILEGDRQWGFETGAPGFPSWMPSRPSGRDFDL